MRGNDVLWMAVNSLTSRRLRSFLTIFGIVVGVISVVTLMGLSNGFSEQVGGQLGGLGADSISVTPGFTRAQGPGGFGGGPGGPGGGQSTTTDTDPLTDQDVRIIAGTDGVEYATGSISGQGEVAYRGETATVSVEGVDPALWGKVATRALSAGRELQAGDAGVVVLGSSIAQDVFESEIGVNQVITIEGEQLRVVGILEAQGGFGRGGGDSGVIVSLTDAASLLGEPDDEYDSITVVAATGYDATEVADEITTRLQASRRAYGDDQDFTVSSSAAFQSQISDINASFTTFLGAVAGVALLVGAIGIANTMFTAVLERAKQIGIMKALGMNNTEIRMMFMLESGLMGLLGGVVGVGLGYLFTLYLQNSGVNGILPGPGSQGGIAFNVTPTIALYSIAGATLIGAVAGVIPAFKAAAMQPVDSLRAE